MGKENPDSPGYAPDFTGETDDGDVGSGRGFGADLYTLYSAGRAQLPATAAAYSGLSETIHGLQPYVSRMVAAGATGLQPLLAVHESLQVGFVKTSQNCTSAGEALVLIVDDYVRTDDEANTGFNEWRKHLAPVHERNDLDNPPVAEEPTRPSDPHEDLGIYPHGSLEPQED